MSKISNSFYDFFQGKIFFFKRVHIGLDSVSVKTWFSIHSQLKKIN